MAIWPDRSACGYQSSRRKSATPTLETRIQPKQGGRKVHRRDGSLEVERLIPRGNIQPIWNYLLLKLCLFIKLKTLFGLAAFAQRAEAFLGRGAVGNG